MNPAEEASALRAFLESRGFNPSGRSLIKIMREIGLKFRDVEVRDAARPQSGRDFRAHGTHSGHTRDAASRASADHSGVSIDSAQGQDRKTGDSPRESSTLSPLSAQTTLLPVPEPAGKTAPKSRGSRIISQYAGATIESFGELAPLVTEVLAIDGFGTETKAFTKALETLAMWRATLGEDALAHGLRIAVDKRIGHRYAGGVARRYDPTEEGPRTPRAAAAAELPDDGPPTRLQLVAEGLAEPIRPEDIPPWERPPTHSLYRPRLQAV